MTVDYLFKHDSNNFSISCVLVNLAIQVGVEFEGVARQWLRFGQQAEHEKAVDIIQAARPNGHQAILRT